MEPSHPLRARFGSFELNLKTAELTNGQQTAVLPRQSFAILILLLEAAGDMVERGEIKSKLWPNDTEVDFDHSINAAIRNLRRALGDSAEKPEYIETLTGRGYRLIVSAEWLPSTAIETPPQDSGQDERLPSGDLTGRKVSHYRILGIIGGGGMGVVYKAEDLKLGRVVAIKFLPEELGSDPRALERFEQEARTASSLDHPNICHIYEFGDHAGQPFIVMQLLEGQTLRDRMAFSEPGVLGGQDGKAIPLEEALDIAIQILSGLAAAHAKGIIHRDIKPANILITTNGTAKILDFGLAKLLRVGEQVADLLGNRDQTPTTAVVQALSTLSFSRTGAAMGTAGYMSPEQVRGEQLDTRTDLFSFGVVFYEMLTGRRAFGGEDITSVHDAILNSSPLPLLQPNSVLSPRFEEIVTKCLQKNRELRYQSAERIASALTGIRRSDAITESNKRPSAQSVATNALRGLRLRVPRKWIALGIAAMLPILIWAGSGYFDSRQPPISIAVFPYSNASGDPGDSWLETVIPQAIQTSLGWSDHVAFVPLAKSQNVFLRAGKPPNAGVDDLTLATLARSLHSDKVVVGQYQLLNGTVKITSTIFDATNNRSAQFTAEGGDLVKLDDKVNEISGKLRDGLALPFDLNLQMVKHSRRASISAIRAYEEGRHCTSIGDFQAAEKSFAEAISLDPGFGIAYAGLADSYFSIGDEDDAMLFARKAMDLRSSVCYEDRSRIESIYDRIQTESSRISAFNGRQVTRSAPELKPFKEPLSLSIQTLAIQLISIIWMLRYSLHRRFALLFSILAVGFTGGALETFLLLSSSYRYATVVHSAISLMISGSFTLGFVLALAAAEDVRSSSGRFRCILLAVVIALGAVWSVMSLVPLNALPSLDISGIILAVCSLSLSWARAYRKSRSLNDPAVQTHRLNKKRFIRIIISYVALLGTWFAIAAYWSMVQKSSLPSGLVPSIRFVYIVQTGCAVLILFMTKALSIREYGLMSGFGLIVLGNTSVMLQASGDQVLGMLCMSSISVAAFMVWFAWLWAERLPENRRSRSFSMERSPSVVVT